MTVFLSTAYLGPIHYFSKLHQTTDIVIERYEHYPKQTYRNRCVIYGANGLQTLSIPVSKGSEIKVYTKDIKIDYSMNWQLNHFRTIESAYRNSPFYLYYMDDIHPLFIRRKEFLYDYTLELTSLICKLTGIPFQPMESQEYIKELPNGTEDFREMFHPKPQMQKTDKDFISPVYRQVFENVHGFKPNISMLDLLFNEGPEAISHLAKSHA